MIINLMRLSILIISGFSAISAVTGLGAVFKGAYWSVVIAGCGIELGRYSLVAYTVQQRANLSRWWIAAVCCIVLCISLFTNLGIFGFLGNSMQATHSKVKQTEIDLTSITVEKQRLEARMTEIDAQIALLPSDYVAGRLKLIQAFAEERKEISSRLKSINEKLSISQVDSIKNLDDLGPIIYTAQAFNITVDEAITGMMWAFTLCLDMFAIFLTVFINLHSGKKEVVKPIKVAEPVNNNHAVNSNDWNFK